ncbi:hypothetical protein QMG83_10540 [Salinibacterium sp. G-O1]|uniref:hypothetical protein n=1 Tax=Salinibacterium sp. G-O1 TaxID=3046208 RepID=UPI0024BBE556|nr:hypothetical protein [Salinibacterium sp. G-O1]MDJ0335660.1 hypothetical protein [Salinibacterium sp. G-O1]
MDRAPVSAGRWELRRRLVLLVTLVAIILILVLGGSRSVDSPALAATTAVLVVVAAVVVWWVGRRQSASVAAEKEAGYSTLYDFEGFELRDYRTGAVIRPRNETPDGGIRRSLLSGMLTVPAGITAGTPPGGRRRPRRQQS